MIKRLRDGRYYVKVHVHKAGQLKHTLPCNKDQCPVCSSIQGTVVDREFAKEIEEKFCKELKAKRKETGSLTFIKYVADALKLYRKNRNDKLGRQESTYKRLFDELGNTPINNCYSALESFVKQHKSEFAPASINRHIAMVKAAINECYKTSVGNGKFLLSENYLRGFPLLDEQNINYLILSEKQIELFWDSLDERLKPFVYFAWRVPIREGEAFNITRDMVDPFNRIIKLPYEYTKQGEQRQIKIIDEFLPYVLGFINSPAQYLFNRGPEEDYRPLGYLNKMGRIEFTLKKPWAVSCVLAGAPGYNMHKMRQQAVMSLWQAGWSEDDIRLYGGWSRGNNRGKDAFDHYFNREMALWIKQGQHRIDLKWWKDFAVQLPKVA